MVRALRPFDALRVEGSASPAGKRRGKQDSNHCDCCDTCPLKIDHRFSYRRMDPTCSTAGPNSI
jgi:hypothetical protein